MAEKGASREPTTVSRPLPTTQHEPRRAIATARSTFAEQTTAAAGTSTRRRSTASTTKHCLGWLVVGFGLVWGREAESEVVALCSRNTWIRGQQTDDKVGQKGRDRRRKGNWKVNNELGSRVGSRRTHRSAGMERNGSKLVTRIRISLAILLRRTCARGPGPCQLQTSIPLYSRLAVLHKRHRSSIHNFTFKPRWFVPESRTPSADQPGVTVVRSLRRHKNHPIISHLDLSNPTQ